jgi:hypothetical protein
VVLLSHITFGIPQQRGEVCPKDRLWESSLLVLLEDVHLKLPWEFMHTKKS